MATSPDPASSGDVAERRTFSTAFRGFDQTEVRAYLEVVAAEFATLRERVRALEAELEVARRPVQSGPLDVAAMTRMLGEETARVLQAAQQAADDLRVRAEEGAARTLSEAHEEAARVRNASDSVMAERTAEVEQLVAQLRGDAEERAGQLTRDAQAEAERTIAAAIEQGRDMVGQAQAARERVLADLNRRRRSGLAQIEALRQGRERLMESLSAVRVEIERVAANLEAADDEARLATEAATPPPKKERAGGEADRHAETPGDDGPPSDHNVVVAGPPTSEISRPLLPETTDPPTPAAPAAVIPDPAAADGEGPSQHVSAGAEDALAAEAALGAAVELGTEGPRDAGEQLVAEGPRDAPDVVDVAAAPEPGSTPQAGEAAPAERTQHPEGAPPPGVARESGAAAGTEAVLPSVERPAYRHDPVPAAVLPAAAVGGDPAIDDEPPAKVDELFARIRADRAVATEQARTALAPTPPAQEGPPHRRRDHGPRPAEVPAVTGGDTGPSDTGPSDTGPGGDGPSGDGPSGATSGVAAEGDDAGLESPRTDAEETYLQRRDVLVEVVLATTVRGLRRSLADDQNAALDRLRTARTDHVDIDALLGEDKAQIGSWSRRAAAGLADGATAGATLAMGAGAPTPNAALVRPVADELARDLVVALRTRLAAVLEAAGKDRGPETVDRINGVYREWRGRIERAVGDAVTSAVSIGFAFALTPGTPVAWVVEDADGPCPDCDDNALAGATPLGDPFPTGQTMPPAHPGCRCVLTQAST
ncbi:MAG: hypothetical protein NVS3B12_26400 [Acidimicrobiales bacterium]